MDKSRFEPYLIANAKYFKPDYLIILRQKLEKADEDVFISLQAVDLKDPMIVLIISVLLGWLGIDRFMIGHIGMGLLKLFTGGGFGIITIYDWFVISGLTRKRNMARVSLVL